MSILHAYATSNDTQTNAHAHTHTHQQNANSFTTHTQTQSGVRKFIIWPGSFVTFWYLCVSCVSVIIATTTTRPKTCQQHSTHSLTDNIIGFVFIILSKCNDHAFLSSVEQRTRPKESFYAVSVVHCFGMERKRINFIRVRSIQMYFA